jgi:hypothetical protein
MRLVSGAGSVVLGVLAFVAALAPDGPLDGPVMLVAAVLLLGGAVLLVPPRLLPPAGRAARLAGGGTVLTGLALAAFLPVPQSCCDAAHTVARGLPAPFVSAGADTGWDAYAHTWSGSAGIDALSIVADVLFWIHAGVLVGAAVALARAARTRTPT